MLSLSVIILTAGLLAAAVEPEPANLEASNNSARQGRAIGTPFAYEAETPQKIRTGCQGFKYGNDGDMDISYYFVDASGQKKFIPNGGSTKVAFPGPALFPGVFKHTNVYFQDFCFPVKCGSSSCGQVVGPVIVVQQPPTTEVVIAPVPPPATPTQPPPPPPTTTAAPTLPPPPKPCASTPPPPAKPPTPPTCPTPAPLPVCQPPPPSPCATVAPQIVLNSSTPQIVLTVPAPPCAGAPPPPMYVVLPPPPPMYIQIAPPPAPLCPSKPPPACPSSN